MKQVVQNVRNGRTNVMEVPDPVCSPGEVLVQNAASVVSAGTERYVVELSKKSLLGKARARPDHVRRVLQKLRQEGAISTFQQVMAKLREGMPLGYATAGTVLASGAGSHEFEPGDRVATAASHAAIVAIGKNLVAKIPEGVSFEQAAYAPLGSIVLEGVRLTKTSLGERVLLIGAGLLGLIGIALLKAQGCQVFVTDVNEQRLALAKEFGADVVAKGSPLDDVMAFSGGFGVDAVLITAATASNDPIEFAAAACRPKGRVVLVGVVGLNLPREPFFKKELEFTVSASLGPGRWDPTYEERGIDYPIGHVRWTAQRNMQAILDTIAAGRLPVEKLTSHRFDVDNAAAAYELVTNDKEPSLGIVLTYPDQPSRREVPIARSAKPAKGKLGVSVVGAGNYARLILLPELRRQKSISLRGLCSAHGLTAAQTADQMSFAYATSEFERLLADEDTKALFVLTRHDLHADFVRRALEAGKHVFVEKPLCIRAEELSTLQECVRRLGGNGPILSVGFNRRFSKTTRVLREYFGSRDPLSIHFRFVTADIPKNVWVHDLDVGGGRLVGEACHALDTAIALADSPVTRVYAEATPTGTPATDDRVVILMRHENGCVSNLVYEAGGDRAGPKERLEVFGGGKSAFVDDWSRIELWRDGRQETVDGGGDKGVATEVARFLDVAARGGDWPIPWEHQVSGAWAAIAAVESIGTGSPIEATST